MSLKRLLPALLACLLLWPVAALAETAGIANQVPILYISDSLGAADALMDDDPSTAWYGTVDPRAEAPTWTVLAASETVKEIWIRNGAHQDLRNYQAAGRVSQLDVTIYHENNQVTTYRYRLSDAFSAENSRDWVSGYQRLLLPQAMRGVFCVELRVRGVTAGSSRNEFAVSDLLLSSGQPSEPSSGVQMRASAPTIRPDNPTMPPPAGDYGASYPTAPPQNGSSSSGEPTSVPPSGNGVGITARLLKRIGVRSGPGTGYDYVGSFFGEGDYVQVIDKVWDGVNNLYWYQVDFTSRGVKYRGYCVQQNRVDLDPSLVPDQPAGFSASLLVRTNHYYGPGTDYKHHTGVIFSTTKGTIYGQENGYVLFDWYDGGNDEYRRAWIPEDVATWNGK